MAKGGKRAGAGRKPGSKNKATIEIQTLVRGSVNFPKLLRNLEKRANKTSDVATKILLEYGFGKPRELTPDNAGTNSAEISREFAKMVSLSGSGMATPNDSAIQDGQDTLQDGSRGPEILQDGDSQADTNHGGDEAAKG